MTDLLPLLRTALSARSPAVLVTITRAEGSTPREAGARMLVTADDAAGTVGGGRLEFEAVLRARGMIAKGEAVAQMDVPLGPRIGQCCGGRVWLALEAVDAGLLARLEAKEAAERAARPHAYVFGAGHTGIALARALAPLPLRAVLVDNRENLLADAPAGVEAVLAAIPESVVADAPPASAFLVMTHDHGLDFLLASAALARGDAAYVGMIGSKTKRARLVSQLRAEAREADAERLICPIGGSRLRDKRPAVIAALAAADVAFCLFSNQGEKLNEGLAGRETECHSDANHSRSEPPAHARAS